MLSCLNDLIPQKIFHRCQFTEHFQNSYLHFSHVRLQSDKNLVNAFFFSWGHFNQDLEGLQGSGTAEEQLLNCTHYLDGIAQTHLCLISCYTSRLLVRYIEGQLMIFRNGIAVRVLHLKKFAFEPQKLLVKVIFNQWKLLTLLYFDPLKNVTKHLVSQLKKHILL